jgi:NADH dehydrogenase (ubiquinone) 1 beta subcomplex subunit 9
MFRLAVRSVHSQQKENPYWKSIAQSLKPQIFAKVSKIAKEAGITDKADIKNLLREEVYKVKAFVENADLSDGETARIPEDALKSLAQSIERNPDLKAKFLSLKEKYEKAKPSEVEDRKKDIIQALMPSLVEEMAHPSLGPLEQKAHTLYVKSLYRQSLRLAMDWYWRREEFREKALIIRQLFDKNAKEKNLKVIQDHLAYAEQTLAVYAHPQPFKYVDAPGGTKFERNVPMPKEVNFIINLVVEKRSYSV